MAELLVPGASAASAAALAMSMDIVVTGLGAARGATKGPSQRFGKETHKCESSMAAELCGNRRTVALLHQ